MYDTYDLTLIQRDNISNDDLIEYLISNHVDLLITINAKQINLNENLKRTKLKNYTEKITYPLTGHLQKKFISLKVDVYIFKIVFL